MTRLKDHITEGITPSRLRLETRRALRPMLVVLACGVVGAIVATVLLTNVNRTWFKDTERLRFTVADATGVTAGMNEVRFKGVPIGTITDVELRGEHPVLTAVVQRRYGDVYGDARATLRPSTALQDMYLDILDRGTKAAGRATASSPLPLSSTETPVAVDDVLNTFGTSTRQRLRQLLNDLGNGLHDRGTKLRETFAEAVPFLRNAGRITDQLAAKRTATKELVRNVRLLTDELAARESLLRRLVADGGTAATTFADGSRDLDALLRQLPPSVAALRGGLQSLRRVLPDLDSAVAGLSPVADALPPALDDVRAISRAAAPALRALRRPVEKLAPVAADLRPVLGGLDRAVSDLRPQTDTIDLVTKRLAGCKKGLQYFFQWNTSMTKFGDAFGAFPRGNFVMGGHSGGLTNAFEGAPPACTPGKPIGGRPPTDAELFPGGDR